MGKIKFFLNPKSCLYTIWNIFSLYFICFILITHLSFWPNDILYLLRTDSIGSNPNLGFSQDYTNKFCFDLRFYRYFSKRLLL